MSDDGTLECGIMNAPKWSDEQPENPPVWLKEYRTYGFLIKQGPYTSIVEFKDDGEVVWEHIENDEWELWREHVSEQWTD